VADATQKDKSMDWGTSLFGLGDTALKGYFGLEAAKLSAKTVQKAPVGSVIAVVGGLVAVVLIIFVLRK